MLVAAAHYLGLARLGFVCLDSVAQKRLRVGVTHVLWTGFGIPTQRRYREDRVNELPPELRTG